MTSQTNESAKQDTQKSIFELQRVYVKSSSSQLTDPTEAFLLKWEPTVGFEIKTTNHDLKTPNHYEAVLEGTITLKIAEKEIGTLKVEQAGIFKIEGFDDKQKKMILSAHCQDILYPYFCAQIARMTSDASFPALLLRPMSFYSLYQQNANKEAA